jgi:hypothetical protein
MPDLRTDADGIFGPSTERALKLFQEIAYLPPTGILDTATLGALNAALDHERLDRVAIEVPKGGAGFRGEVELHFYPGPQELKLYVLKDGKVLATYGMVGGRAEKGADPWNPHIGYDPTPAGKYVVDLISPHASSVWAYSYVPYGAPLREVDGEIQFRDDAGQWRWATGPKGIFAARNPPPLNRDGYLDEHGRVRATWTLNDFGHLRARLKSVATGTIQTHMIHAIPRKEGTAAYFENTEALTRPDAAEAELGYSHGCEHIHARDLDDLVARGYLAPGTRFVVHGYDEVFAGS